jgi:caffeoyl-CoA O-methyltransferase
LIDYQDNFMLQKDLAHQYAIEHTSPVSASLVELERETNLKTLAPQMISGAYQGKLLEFITYMIRPKQVLEIGTFTGYASLCIAEGLPEGGKLHTIEVDEELAFFIQKYKNKAGLANKIIHYTGDAAKIIPQINEKFDLIFMDAGKLDYSNHYELALSRTNPGGFILADNVLWDNKVFSEDKDSTTIALRAFNDFVQNDPRVENFFLPLRDGLLIIRKK